MAFDLDKNKFVGAAEIRHVLVNIGEQVSQHEKNALCDNSEGAPCRMQSMRDPRVICGSLSDLEFYC